MKMRRCLAMERQAIPPPLHQPCIPALMDLRVHIPNLMSLYTFPTIELWLSYGPRQYGRNIFWRRMKDDMTSPSPKGPPRSNTTRPHVAIQTSHATTNLPVATHTSPVTTHLPVATHTPPVTTSFPVAAQIPSPTTHLPEETPHTNPITHKLREALQRLNARCQTVDDDVDSESESEV